MDDETLVRLFEAGEAPPDGFRHRDHVRVAWWYLRRDSFPAALDRFSERLKNFATAQGKPQLFHATITTAYMLVIAERLATTDPQASWDEFAAQHPDLLTWRPSVLDRYYTEATLMSDRARREFVKPDRMEGDLLGPGPSQVDEADSSDPTDDVARFLRR